MIRDSNIVILATVLGCAAVWMLVTGWRQPRPSLEQTVRRRRRAADGERTSGAEPSESLAESLAESLGRALLGAGLRERTLSWMSPLHLAGHTLAAHVGRLALAAIAGFVVPLAVISIVAALGLFPGSVLTSGLVALTAAVGVPVALHSSTMSRSQEIRIDLRHQLTAFLDMVTMLLAGNTGHEGALRQAAEAGDGRLFRELRRRMREVGTTGNSLIGALTLVGNEFGVVELEQVANAARLSAAEGAPVARTLAAKCATLRSSLAAEQEAAARIRNDKVTPPLVGMALLFMALIIYPALALN